MYMLISSVKHFPWMRALKTVNTANDDSFKQHTINNKTYNFC